MLKAVILVSATLVFAQDAHASRRPLPKPAIPTSIACVPAASANHIAPFSITKLNTKEPEASFSDASLNGYSDELLLTLSFSNECDNYYMVSFYRGDLENLQTGLTQEVRGLMNYSNADFEWNDEAGRVGEATVEVVCRKR